MADATDAGESRHDGDEQDREHQYDVFRPGDRLPWRGKQATVTDREVREIYPEDAAGVHAPSDHQPPEADEDTGYVVLTIQTPTEGDVRASASSLATGLSVGFDQTGLPTVRADRYSGLNQSETVAVQTPATGNNHLSPNDAHRLAAFLRNHRDEEPLYALLGGVSTPEDMDALADALADAAALRTIQARLRGDDTDDAE